MGATVSRTYPVTRLLPMSYSGVTSTYPLCHLRQQNFVNAFSGNRVRLVHNAGMCESSVRNIAADPFTKIQLPEIDYEMLEKEPKAKFTVSIEGNIGSGKSTLLQHFKKFEDVEVLQEPVHKWRDVRGYNLLDLMYKDPCRWAHTFQTYVQMTMLELHLKATTAPVKLIERSLFSARYCFVENLYRAKKMSDPEYAVYCEWYKTILGNLDVDLDLIVYLRTDPCKLHERIQKRARTEEQTIPLQYLKDLHALHEEWLIEKKHDLTTQVLILDANDSLSAMHEKFKEHTAEILCKKIALPSSENEAPQAIASAAN